MTLPENYVRKRLLRIYSSDRPFRFLDPGADNNSIRVYCRNPTARDISADIEKKRNVCRLFLNWKATRRKLAPHLPLYSSQDAEIVRDWLRDSGSTDAGKPGSLALIKTYGTAAAGHQNYALEMSKKEE